MAKKNFFKTAITILKYLVENWEILYPLIDNLIEELKDGETEKI